MKPKHILVVDDEESLCEILRFNLEREGYDVTTAESAERALTLDLERFDLAILDVMMGELSGFSLARIIRSRPSTADMPVIFCTARDSAQDAVEGLDIGADDYVTKPFSVAELSARVRSVLRRSSHSSRTAGELLRYEGLVLDMDAKRASVDGEVVALTRKEFDILALLMSNRPHRGCQHHAHAPQDRALRAQSYHTHRLRLWLRGLDSLTAGGCFCSW